MSRYAMQLPRGRGVYLRLIPDLGTRLVWVVSVTLRPRSPLSPERIPGTHCTGGWVGLRGGRTRARGKSVASVRDRSVVQNSSLRLPIPRCHFMFITTDTKLLSQR
jgi:hypothetical protein